MPSHPGEIYNIRLTWYGVFAGFFLGLVGTIIGQFHWMIAVGIGLILAVLLGLVLELYIRYPQRKVYTATGQDKLLKAVPSISDAICKSNRVYLLGGTLKSFVDNEENLKALVKFRGDNGKLRILIMNPFATCISTTVRARIENNRSQSIETFGHEITDSFRRMHDNLIEKDLLDCVRLYDYPAFYSSYIMGHCAFITVYTYGRGGNYELELAA